jgi:transcriptional regulator with XRE-family HTH domain
VETKRKPENEFQKRMQWLAQQAGDVSKLARKTGLSITAVRNYLYGGEPTRTAIQKLARSMDVSIEWLVSGKGSAQNDSKDSERLLRIPLFKSQDLANHLLLKNSVEVNYSALKTETLVIAAQKLEQIMYVSDPKLILIRMEDATMEPLVREGHIVFIDTNDRTMRPGIFAVVQNGYLMISGVEHSAGSKFRLISEKKRSDSDFVEFDITAEGSHVVGRALGSIGRFRPF